MRQGLLYSRLVSIPQVAEADLDLVIFLSLPPASQMVGVQLSKRPVPYMPAGDSGQALMPARQAHSQLCNISSLSLASFPKCN